MLSALLLLLSVPLFSANRVLAQKAAEQASTAEEPAAEATAEATAAESSEKGPEPSPEAKAAKEAFDAQHKKWEAKIGEIQAVQEKRQSARGAERDQLDKDLTKLRNEAAGLIDDIVDAGVAVYAADSAAYPRVNSTILAIAQFYLLGDANGDGGDQYERAYSLIQKMLEAGAAKDWPYLDIWGGVAAFHINEFAAAEELFGKARDADVLGPTPPNRNSRDPNTRLWQMAQDVEGRMPALKSAWDKEQEIRKKEAEADDLPRIKFTTNRGEVVIELFENEAPQAVANIITLVKKGYYDGVTFHRVLPGFMAQGGDPDGTGTGGPGYNIRSEYNKPGARKHFRGSLSMANTGRPNTGGSQFFLTFVPTSFLDGRHTVFGRVMEGMEVAASLKRRDPQERQPPKPDRIIKAEVLRDRGHEYEFEKLPE